MEKLSVVILTYNSARYLNEVLASCAFADEVMILDSGSEDETLSIARSHGVRIEQQSWQGFGAQKQKAIELACNDWVFVLDSDEVITKALQEEIATTLQVPQYHGYSVARLNHFFGRPIKHGGLYPDRTIRLFDRRYGHFTPEAVHEKVVVQGKVGQLSSPMIHYAYESIDQFIEKQNRYALLGAKPNRFKALFNPLWTFFRIYCLKAGFMDGWEGFLIARLYSQYTFWKYAQTPKKR